MKRKGRWERRRRREEKEQTTTYALWGGYSLASNLGFILSSAIHWLSRIGKSASGKWMARDARTRAQWQDSNTSRCTDLSRISTAQTLEHQIDRVVLYQSQRANHGNPLQISKFEAKQARLRRQRRAMTYAATSILKKEKIQSRRGDTYNISFNNHSPLAGLPS